MTTPTADLRARRQAMRPKRSEHDEQCALFQWASLMTGRAPELALLYAIPNGGHRHPATAARMKAEGQKAGVPDIHLPIARREWHGLYMELKVGSNKLTAVQREWFALLQAAGHMVDVSYGWQEAAHKIVRYLGYEPEEFGV